MASCSDIVQTALRYMLEALWQQQSSWMIEA
jgi:hypothetical protein